jgi:hypothetical protein
MPRFSLGVLLVLLAVLPAVGASAGDGPEAVGLSDDTAVVRVDLSRDGKHVFTDFLSLYKTAKGWQIVAKVFRRHS